MRTRAVLVLSGAAIVASTTFLACGSGDDSAPGATSTPPPDASTADGSLADGATTSHDGGVGDAKAGDGGEATLALKHVFYIMMENHSFDEILGPAASANAPYINQLAGTYGVASKYYGVTHPSLPNYLAAISGDFQGIFDDCAASPTKVCAPEEFVPGAGAGTSAALLTTGQAANAAILPHWFTGRNLVDQLENHQLTWMAYMQGIPGVGDTSEYWPYSTLDGGADASLVPLKLYAQKHDPFMYFADVRTNDARMRRIVPFTGFAGDIVGSSVPNFVWISPDQCHDMHGVSAVNAAALGIAGCDVDSSAIKLGDDFIKDTVGKIMASPAWNEPSAIVIAWDEDDYAGTSGCCGSPTGEDGGVLGGANAPALVITSKNAKHQTVADPYNHYSLLATIQQIWGLGCLGNTCGMTGPQLMTKLFLP